MQTGELNVSAFSTGDKWAAQHNVLVLSFFPRMIVCNQVMKYILDKIDKEEKQAAKKRKREESVEQKRSKQTASKLSALLFKHKEQLKAEILKKRALLDKELQIEVQVRAVILKGCKLGRMFLCLSVCSVRV